MCFVRGLYFEVNSSSLAPSLSSKTVHLVVIAVAGSFKTVDSSMSNSLNGKSSLIVCDSDMYSASVVLNAISVWSLLHRMIGQQE